MTWSEYILRLHAYKRSDKNDWYKVREMCYHSTYGGGYMGKKPPSKEVFMPLGKTSKVSKERIRDAIKKAQDQYVNEVKEREKNKQ